MQPGSYENDYSVILNIYIKSYGNLRSNEY